MHSFWEEQSRLREGLADKICAISGTSGQWDIGSKNYTIPEGNCQSIFGSLAVKIVQILRGNGITLWGTWQQKLYNS